MGGKLYGVGVGPGDPELLTLKALRILRSVTVLAWPGPEKGPSLARDIIAEYLPGTQREIAIRMPLLSAQFPADDVYDKAAIEIKDALDAGEDVAVICEGDPFFYGSFMYLFGRLANDRSIEVVPGVSSLTACAAALDLRCRLGTTYYRLSRAARRWNNVDETGRGRCRRNHQGGAAYHKN